MLIKVDQTRYVEKKEPYGKKFISASYFAIIANFVIYYMNNKKISSFLIDF